MPIFVLESHIANELSIKTYAVSFNKELLTAPHRMLVSMVINHIKRVAVETNVTISVWHDLCLEELLEDAEITIRVADACEQSAIIERQSYKVGVFGSKELIELTEIIDEMALTFVELTKANLQGFGMQVATLPGSNVDFSQCQPPSKNKVQEFLKITAIWLTKFIGKMTA